MPIVEPEVLMDGDHTIEESYRATHGRCTRSSGLRDQRVELEGTLLEAEHGPLGLQLPTRPATRGRRETIRCLRHHVPAAVPGSSSSRAARPTRRRRPT